MGRTLQDISSGGCLDGCLLDVARFVMKHFPLVLGLFVVVVLGSRPHGIVGQVGVLLAGIGVFAYAIYRVYRLVKEWNQEPRV
ncbi:MAG: hypothetical protein Q4E01_04590 [Actinomycetaceae bacterium]|nr:hypothetical protein [Actinomycetaceae bacterium]